MDKRTRKSLDFANFINLFLAAVIEIVCGYTREKRLLAALELKTKLAKRLGHVLGKRMIQRFLGVFYPALEALQITKDGMVMASGVDALLAGKRENLLALMLDLYCQGKLLTRLVPPKGMHIRRYGVRSGFADYRAKFVSAIQAYARQAKKTSAAEFARHCRQAYGITIIDRAYPHTWSVTRDRRKIELQERDMLEIEHFQLLYELQHFFMIVGMAQEERLLECHDKTTLLQPSAPFCSVIKNDGEIVVPQTISLADKFLLLCCCRVSHMDGLLALQLDRESYVNALRFRLIGPKGFVAGARRNLEDVLETLTQGPLPETIMVNLRDWQIEAQDVGLKKGYLLYSERELLLDKVMLVPGIAEGGVLRVGPHHAFVPEADISTVKLLLLRRDIHFSLDGTGAQIAINDSRDITLLREEVSSLRHLLAALSRKDYTEADRYMQNITRVLRLLTSYDV